MQFVADPGLLVSFAVLLAAHIAFPRQVRQHLLQRHLALPLHTRRFRGRQWFPFFPSSLLTSGLGWLGRNRRTHWFFAGFDLGGIPRDVADQPVFLGFLDERRMHPLRQFSLRKFGKRTRKLRFMRNFPLALPAA